MKYLKFIATLSLLCSSLFLQGLEFQSNEELKNYVENNKYNLMVNKYQEHGRTDYLMDLPNEELVFCRSYNPTEDKIDCFYGDKTNPYSIYINKDFYFILKKKWEKTGSGKGITKRVKSE